MRFKKSIIAGGSAVALAIAGTGVAAATDGTDLPPQGAGSVEGSFNGEALSTEAGAIYGSVPMIGEGEGAVAGDHATIEQALNALGAIAVTGAAIGGAILAPVVIYDATKDFQQFVDDFTEDSRNFINSITP